MVVRLSCGSGLSPAVSRWVEVYDLKEDPEQKRFLDAGDSGVRDVVHRAREALSAQWSRWKETEKARLARPGGFTKVRRGRAEVLECLRVLGYLE